MRENGVCAFCPFPWCGLEQMKKPYGKAFTAVLRTKGYAAFARQLGSCIDGRGAVFSVFFFSF